jgi:AbrB family looped-hinge helix DNA binding protein
MITTISSKGQVVLPAELRKRDNIKAGEEFEVRQRLVQAAGSDRDT